MIAIATRLSSADVGSDKLVVVGQNIDETSLLMKLFGDGGYLLDMMPTNGSGLKMWQVSDGIVIAVYSEESRNIINLSYFLADERPKSTRKTFSIPVKSFSPITREMLAVLPMDKQ